MTKHRTRERTKGARIQAAQFKCADETIRIKIRTGRERDVDDESLGWVLHKGRVADWKGVNYKRIAQRGRRTEAIDGWPTRRSRGV